MIIRENVFLKKNVKICGVFCIYKEVLKTHTEFSKLAVFLINDANRLSNAAHHFCKMDTNKKVQPMLE